MDLQKNTLARYLSRLDVWALSLSCIIGWGAFVMPGTTFLPIAGPAGTTIAMVISALIMGVIGVNYFYLMVKNPGVGGVYAYTKKAYGRGHAFLSAWFLCLSYLALISQNATALAVMCRALFSGAVERGAHYRIAGYDMYLAEALIAVAVLVGIGILAIRCKPFLQRLQTGLAVLLLAGVIGIAGITLAKVPLREVLSSPGFGSANPAMAVLSIVVLAPWAFVGFEVISLETAHFRFPVRKSWRLIGVAIALGGFIYIAMSVVAMSVVPDGYATWQEYINDLGRFKGYAALPTFHAVGELMGEGGLVLIGITAVAAVLSSVIGFYRATGRILSNMAADRILNRGFSSPRFCYCFIMGISILISLLGRNALSWVVDLSSFGAIVGFGYASMVAARTARREGDKRFARFGAVGIVLSVVFVLTQLLPKVSAIETMQGESYFLLALWCLLGFAFYWRTMTQGGEPEHNSETATISALFILQFYAALVWYVKKMLSAADGASGLWYSAVFAMVVLLGLLVMLLIMGQLKKRQEQLEAERIRAVESSRAKSQFLFHMSHDLRTPMNAIMGFTHLARQPGASVGEKDEYLGKIDHAGEQLLSIINDVLDMSQIENGKLEITPKPASIAEVIRETGGLFDMQMHEKGIAYTVDVSGVRHEWVLCDKNRLSRVVMSLLSNALKFTPEGGTIDVKLCETGEGEGMARYRIHVKDTGIGMNAEFAENMFTPFARERTSTDSGLQGAGLGLSITKGIVDSMGGAIDVQTAPGRGSEFTVSLELPTVDAPPAPETPALTAPKPEGPARLLLVEDNAVNLEIAKMILEQEGFLLDTAENGQVAVDMVAASKPGYYRCILMDIQMPVMDGYTATRRIRALADPALRSIPIIAMTANAFVKDREDAANAGMQGHIAKPLDIETMMATIREVLDGQNP